MSDIYKVKVVNPEETGIMEIPVTFDGDWTKTRCDIVGNLIGARVLEAIFKDFAENEVYCLIEKT